MAISFELESVDSKKQSVINSVLFISHRFGARLTGVKAAALGFGLKALALTFRRC